jgi:aryl-alcohol dehydrogenase-like predicted oxidoreductase/enamine deaminase RidA (YjgF/YER057c/UK114 family)
MPTSAAPDAPTSDPVVPRIALAPGLEVARILTGLWQIADMERDGTSVDPEVGARAMEAYVAAGLTSFDMADHYGSAEVIAGHYRATRGAGAPAETLTKWVPKPGPVSMDDVRAAVDLAAQRLRTDRLELLQFHTWTYDDPAWLDALSHLARLRDEGRIGELGLTNVDTAHLKVALDSGLPIVSNQVSFSLLDRRAAHGLAPLCAQRGIHLLAYGTLAGGLLTDRWLDRPEPSWDDDATPWSLNKYRRFIEQVGGWDAYQAVLRAARAVADRHGASIANVATRAILDTPGVGAVIVGARLGESEHVADTLRTFALELDDDDRAELQTAIDALSPVPGDCGDEYRKPPFLTASGDLSHHLETLPAPYPTEHDEDGRVRVATGTLWEGIAGYARAVREGDRIHVSGTTANHGDRLVGGTDAASQTHFVLDKIEGTLRSLGARLEDVVRTRVFVADPADVEAVSRAHGARLGHVRPANTLVLAGLVGDELKVEIEAEAIVRDAR